MHLIDTTLLSKMVPVYRGARGVRQQANIRAISMFLPATLLRYGVTTQLRQAHFLAQVCEESWGLSDMKEERSGAEYQGRKDLANTQPGDGVRFKGRGLIQLTGRANYQRMGHELDLDLVGTPELAETPAVAVETACRYWLDKGLNQLADLDDLKGITRRINGRLMLGLKQRATYLARAKALLDTDRGPTTMVHPVAYGPDGQPIYAV
ncbi:MAG: glycoside hydrolase family 19 protein [Janthinobacterium lividum]